MTRGKRARKHGGRREGAGRPPERDALSERLVIRLAPELLERVERAAAARGVSVPDYVRTLLEDAEPAKRGRQKGVAGKRKGRKG